jgi:hypothetical protein
MLETGCSTQRRPGLRLFGRPVAKHKLVAARKGTRLRMTDLNAINDEIQHQLVTRGLRSVTAVEAAQWVDEVGLLRDSASRRGLPLRRLLRDQGIDGQRQESNGRWFIDAVLEQRDREKPLLDAGVQRLLEEAGRLAEPLLAIAVAAIALPGVTDDLTEQGGAAFKYRGDPLCNIFPRKSVQFPALGQESPPSWVVPGRYLKLYLSQAPTSALLEADGIDLLEQTYRVLRDARDPLLRGGPHAGVVLIPYRPAPEPELPEYVDPYPPNLELLDRGNRAHRAIEGELAELVRSTGLEPCKASGGVDFDIGWEWDKKLVVVEVKSLTRDNETRQLRLGLGQLLHYAHVLAEDGRWAEVIPVLAVERQPYETGWIDLCRGVGVALVWRESLGTAPGLGSKDSPKG